MKDSTGARIRMLALGIPYRGLVGYGACEVCPRAAVFLGNLLCGLGGAVLNCLKGLISYIPAPGQYDSIGKAEKQEGSPVFWMLSPEGAYLHQKN